MKKKIIAFLVCASLCAAPCFSGQYFKKQTNTQKEEISLKEEDSSSLDDRKVEKEETEKEEDKEEEVVEETTEVAEYVPETYDYSYDYTYDYSTSGLSDTARDFMSAGVVYDENGTRYTYYSSNVAYHYRTAEWTPNENGMYTTGDGYLVVASSDYPQGTIISTPWGDAQVLDSGCASGTVDMYVNY